MKITIDESSDNKETEIVIKCSALDDNLKRLIEIIKNSDERIIGIINGTSNLISPTDIYYFESVDKKTFIYTETQVLETSMRLYEIEEKLSKYDFFRASKSTIINISKIKKLSPKFNGRLDALLENGEKLIISRQYVPVIKEILDL
ncbi:putative HTH-type transcriptional regulator [Clostridium homopropionicum DSM 5847]|uniref:Putative HTH-type transcriptional regulator n=1 Tax=Clostridium homopropionicum DSM 5847 TaxID=1121318 RepID=A0A0L6Z6Q2_9CLOT|nr:LytTR family DNA-binding domain-containing protein [Clostridium homopropionicum]KOA18636.1 putative HTH-type transcriptional regulator [Clostridium homopropionicum DSM 5847]SFG50864.1 transcriptional regulator, LytTR family [Clostridium homopropionicum]